MTRKEAKQWLEAMKSSYALPIETYEAIDLAIEALTAPQTDLISRADAIKAVEQEYRIDRGYMVDDYTYGFNQAIDYVSDIILPDLPSADAVPQLKQTDTLIIADALRYLAQDTERNLADRTRADALRQQFLKCGARMKGGDDK